MLGQPLALFYTPEVRAAGRPEEKVLSQALHDRVPEIERNGLALEQDLPDEPQWITGDRVRLGQLRPGRGPPPRQGRRLQRASHEPVDLDVLNDVLTGLGSPTG